MAARLVLVVILAGLAAPLSAIASNEWAASFSAEGYVFLVSSRDCYTAGEQWVAVVQATDSRHRWAVSACAEDGSGVPTEICFGKAAVSDGAWTGGTCRSVSWAGPYSGVDGLPIDAAEVATVFAAIFIPMVSLYLVCFGIRCVFNVIRGRRA